MVTSPTVISTFAGAGGSSLGYQMAGYDERLAVEWDDHAAQTFRLNFPDVPLYHGDIAALTSDHAMELAGLKRGELDVLDGSPPCQGFSTSGKRKFDDPRNSLFIEYARMLEDLQPKAFVMENVTGLVQGYMKQAYLKIAHTLKAAGYRVRGEVMNANHYHVPQKRRRVIIIGVRNDLKIEPSHPRPTTNRIGCTRIDGIPGRYSDKRYGDQIVIEGKPTPTLTKLGRFFWDRRTQFGPKSYAHAASFPESFQWTGTPNQIKDRLGNSVPPKLMQAIAQHVRTTVFDA